MNNSFLVKVAFLLGVFTQLSAASVRVDVGEAVGNNQITLAKVIRPISDGFIVADDSSHRIVVLEKNGRVRASIGSIGQHPGELFEIEDFVVSKDEDLIVSDAGGTRIQVFDRYGALQSHFTLATGTTGMCVNSKGELLISYPFSGNLVSVYSMTGKRLRSFGTLKTYSALLGDFARRFDDSYHGAISHVKLACDSADNVYVALMSGFLVQKYDQTGKLLFEAPIAPRLYSSALREFARSGRAPVTTRVRGESVNVPYVAASLSVDEPSGRIFVGLSWNQPWLIVLDRSGQTEAELTVNYLARNNRKPAPVMFSVQTDSTNKQLLGAQGKMMWSIDYDSIQAAIDRQSH
jgi:hypothetical protein